MTNPPWEKKTIKPRRNNVHHLKLVSGQKAGRQRHRDAGVAPDKVLTSKQTAFIENMLKGMSGAEAYRRSYSAENMSLKAQSGEAAKLLAHPAISLRLEQGFALKQEKARHTAASLREFVTDGLYREASEAGTDAARIRAYELLGKIDYVGLFKERIGNEDDRRSAEEIKAELEQRLKEAFGRLA